MGRKEKKPKYRRNWFKGVSGKLGDGASRGRRDHRIFVVGRDLWGSSSPTPLPKQGRLDSRVELKR